MRKLLCLMLAVAALAGCTGQTGDDDDNLGTSPDGAVGNVTAPPPLQWSGDIVVGADPFNALGTPVTPAPAPCSQKPAGQDVSCEYHEFTVNGTFTLTATLAWGVAANDLDLYLFQGTTEVSRDGINSLGAVGVPPTEQVMRASVGAGTYSFWVVLWNAAADSYTLDVEFA